MIEKYIQKAEFLMKDFKSLVLQSIGKIKATIRQIAARARRPLIYLTSSQIRKDPGHWKIQRSRFASCNPPEASSGGT